MIWIARPEPAQLAFGNEVLASAVEPREQRRLQQLMLPDPWRLPHHFAGAFVFDVTSPVLPASPTNFGCAAVSVRGIHVDARFTA